jgi:transcriptional regulator with XRE-family HTH domain
MSSAFPRYPNRIKEHIHAAGYTIREITVELRIPERTMRDYLTGRTAMPKEYLEALAVILGCSLEDLLSTSLAASSFWSVPYQRNAFFSVGAMVASAHR